MFKRGFLKQNASAITLIARFVDVLLILAIGLIAYAGYVNQWPMEPQYPGMFVRAGLLVLLVFPLFGIYQSWRGGSLYDELRQCTLAWGVVLVALIMLMFVTKTGSLYSRMWLGLWAVFGWAGLMVFHSALRVGLRWLRQRGYNIRRVAVIGAGRLGRDVAHNLREAPWTGFILTGIYDDDPNLHGNMVGGMPVAGSADDLIAQVRNGGVDEIWLALPLRAEERMQEIMLQLRNTTVNVRFVPNIFGFSLLNHSMGEVAGVPVLNLNTTPMMGANRLLKAVEDRILAMLILILASPLMALIAVAVKLTSPGPVLFRQERHGWDGKAIKIYKFRTMVLHAEPDGCVTQCQKIDMRVTRLGAFLRRTSLDELPQFINVLQGRMSIVGPRPHAVEHNAQYKELIDDYMQRHKVKPGITGWAQVNGWRGETDTLDKMRKRVEYDLHYISNWSLWFDLKIMALTLVRGFFHKNAY
jgi:putative colanic acid biosynthesis UDP-glucose lipid carrier transferase